MDSSTGARARAWIADDGELFTLRSLLREHEIPYGELSNDPPEELDLLVSNPRRALEVERQRNRFAPRIHIVMAGDDLTRTMRQRLQRSSCDFIVPEDVHPGALRLLVDYALYRGPERRVGARVPMDVEVKLKVGWRQRKATLLQLSERGCGVVMGNGIADDEMLLRLPPSWTGGRKVDLPVTVIDRESLDDGDWRVSLGFRRVDRDTRQILRDAIKRAAAETGRLQPGRGGSAAASVARRASPPRRPAGSPRADEPAKRPSTSEELPRQDRRQGTRPRYTRRLLATREGEAQVVIGQDISEGGMRIGREPGLEVGQELKLALYGSRSDERVVVRGRVVRDDGPAGFGLRFEKVTPEVQEKLDRLVASLRILGRPAGGDAARPGVVVSQILEREDA